MTSPLRKKHQTTPPSTREASRTDSCRLDVLVGSETSRSTQDELGNSSFVVRAAAFDSSTWLPAALLATLVLLASALQAFGSEPQPLQWRPAFAPGKMHAAKRIAAPRTAAQRAATSQPQSQKYDVVQVVFEDDNAWSNSGSQPEGGARMESVLVYPRDPQFEGTGPAHRVAQDPFENDNLDDELSRAIDQPFGASQLPDTGIDELPEPVEPQLPETLDDELDLDDEPMDEPLEDDELFDDDEPMLQPGAGERDFQPVPGGPRRPMESTLTSPRATEKFEEERLKAEESCQEAFAANRADRITTIDLSIRVTGKPGLDYPFECKADETRPYDGRNWAEVTYMWKAAGNCHKPLYFEQHHLERYGHSWGPCLQPIISGAHFFTRLPVLPYCMGITPPNECIYPLGYYRPGNCAPYMVDPIPFSWRAAAFQAGATVGTAAILP